MEPHANYAFWLACIYPPFGELLTKDPDRALQSINLRLPDTERKKLKGLLEGSYTFSGNALIDAFNSLVAQKLGPPPPPPPPWQEIAFLHHQQP